MSKISKMTLGFIKFSPLWLFAVFVCIELTTQQLNIGSTREQNNITYICSSKTAAESVTPEFCYFVFELGGRMNSTIDSRGVRLDFTVTPNTETGVHCECTTSTSSLLTSAPLFEAGKSKAVM